MDIKRSLTFNIEVDKDGNYKLTSHEPESGTNFIVDAGNLNILDEENFEKKVGMEVLSWIECWIDEMAEEEKENE